MSNRGGWLGLGPSDPPTESFVARTCRRCQLRFALVLVELRLPPAPPAKWICARCQRATGGWGRWLELLKT
jgi:hypothetical protein